MRTFFCLLLCLFSVSTTQAETVRVLPPGQLPADKRLGPLVDLNGYFPFTPSKTKEDWDQRAERLRRQLLVATGLYPMPTRTPANAVVHGPVDRDGYTVEKVLLERIPGHFVTGNLYRPKGRTGRLPAVLSPHGHWPEGRFYDAGEKSVRESIVDGAERFEIGGRYPLQARCVQLARMGCIVFHYDMVGYADSVQLAHRPGVRPEMNTLEHWGYCSPQAEAHLQTMMGLQTYNSLCALDWLAGRDDVDPARIAVTGASGGGTQTFVLCAIDSRPAVAFPAVMVSTAMQGGCTCENASYLRRGAGNVEIAALIAPRPLGMTAADDWTKEIATKGLPELKEHWKLLGAEGLVMAKPLLQFPHNYNYVSREVMYHFVNKHLKLGQPEPIVEEDFKPLTVAELSVWDASQPKPASGGAYERSLLDWINADSEKQMQALAPKDVDSLARYRDVIGSAVDVLIGRSVPGAGEIGVGGRQDVKGDSYVMSKLMLRYTAKGEEVPAFIFMPKTWNRQVVVWVHPQGKQSLLDADGKPRASVAKLLAAGTAVIGIDLLGQGEFTADGKPLAAARLNASGQDNWAKYAGYTFGYNDSLFAQRVHDILSAISYARHGLAAERVHLAGFDGAGHWVIAARAQAGAAVDRAAADTGGFRFAKLTAVDDPNFLPGGAKYLDLPGMAALSAPHALWLAGEGTELPAITSAAYAAAKASTPVLFSGDTSKREAAGVDWLIK